jgi:NAD(P)-dependent dehydrogenase (short-subunit alcohol dehydrogenase family)
MGRLDGKVAIVTGGTSGIGTRTVEVFVDEGATVVFCGRREALGQEIAGRVGDKAEFVKVDVAVESEVESLIKGTAERHGRLDVLFNNAGGPAPTGSIAGIDMDAYHRAMDVLLAGVVHGIKHAAPIMTAQGAGSIISNGSIAAFQAGWSTSAIYAAAKAAVVIAAFQAGWSTSAIYAAAKAAVVQLTRCVAMELGEQGVRVNTISPGFIATEILGKALGVAPDKVDAASKVTRELFAGVQPIKRAGVPDDIAQVAVFLASDAATFVTGIDIVVDGGLTGGRHWSTQHEALAKVRGAFEAAGLT